MFTGTRRLFLAAAIAVSCSAAAHATESTGAGSTFVYPLISKWSADYGGKTGDKLTYQSVGSGGGIAQIKAATVDFAAADLPLSPEDLEQTGLGQFPLVIGGIVPVVNLDGVAAGQLRFTGPLLADIYLGKVSKWNDPAIKAINPDMALPDERITVVHRTDGSGTTFNWVTYLAKVSPEWKGKVGDGMSVSWPIGVGGKGNEGVAAYVARVKYSIGYVEYSYALRNKMTYASVRNKAGKFVNPSMESFQAAAASADWKSARDFFLGMTDAPGDQAYPLTAIVFILMYKQPKDPARFKAALDFFRWALESGQEQAIALNYVPLPPALVGLIETYWTSDFKM